MNRHDARPPALGDLESIYGPESQAGFGAAVFWRPARASRDLAAVARDVYEHFVGPLWDRFGEDAWMGPWRSVHERTGRGDVVAELRAIDDPEARRSVSLLLEPGSGAARAEAALHGAFDAAEVERLEIFNVGDGEAMSGLLVAAALGEYVLALVVLMD